MSWHTDPVPARIKLSKVWMRSSTKKLQTNNDGSLPGASPLVALTKNCTRWSWRKEIIVSTNLQFLQHLSHLGEVAQHPLAPDDAVHWGGGEVKVLQTSAVQAANLLIALQWVKMIISTLTWIICQFTGEVFSCLLEEVLVLLHQVNLEQKFLIENAEFIEDGLNKERDVL